MSICSVLARPVVGPRASMRRLCRRICVAALLSFAVVLPPPTWAASHSATPADVADPDAPAPKTRYRSVIGTFTRYRPVEPSSWQGVNRVVAPRPNPPSQDRR